MLYSGRSFSGIFSDGNDGNLFFEFNKHLLIS